MQGRQKIISIRSVQNKTPDRLSYLQNKLSRLRQFISKSFSDIYNALIMTLSMDQMDMRQFKKIIAPIATSAAALCLSELYTHRMRTAYQYDESYDALIKLALGYALLSLSVSHRITEASPEGTAELSIAIARDVVAIANLQSSFNLSRNFFAGNIGASALSYLPDYRLPDDQSLIVSLAVTAFIRPFIENKLIRKYHEKIINRRYKQGAQRSDTAIISAGRTPIMNLYLQWNEFMLTELATLSRQFQLALISYNILKADNPLQQFRNLPALLADVGPTILKKLVIQHKKINADYAYNTATQKVLKLTKEGPIFLPVKRHQLRKNNLVQCDSKFDTSSVPISGEILALSLEGNSIKEVAQEVSVNLQAHTGEPIWIKQITGSTGANVVDLFAIRQRYQVGVLTGAKLNLHGKNNVFIQVKKRQEQIISSDFVKQSVIDSIIAQHKNRCVKISTVCSVGTAALTAASTSDLPAAALGLIFTLYQMQIPFSETFLRDMINNRFLKRMNRDLLDTPLKIIDTLRIVDLCNALGNYYPDKFPAGVALISDKTGTLTTSGMNVLGLWTSDMKPDIQRLVQDRKSEFLESKQQDVCFEVFASAYTNKEKELEPEEHAILQMFKKFYGEDCLQMDKDTLGDDYFRKHLHHKTIETVHLGLYREFGGRFSIVADQGNYYLVFCGVPKSDYLKDSPLFKDYWTMTTRKGVLSRDWCVGRTPIEKAQFEQLKELHLHKNKNEQARDRALHIDNFFRSNPAVINNLRHYGTFIIDNPVKKNAENFIANCRKANMPVFVATGDTCQAAQNIALVLCQQNLSEIITVKAAYAIDYKAQNFKADSTVIFARISDDVLDLFDKIMQLPMDKRPVVLFAEMSAGDKGKLSCHLKKQGYFVVANGDGSNDIEMMKHAHTVFAHVLEDGSYSPGVEQYVDISDQQLRRLFRSEKSFYELFDIQDKESQFIQFFSPLANSQEKPSLALIPKGIKMSWDCMQALGQEDVMVMPHQHWWSIVYDCLFYLPLAFYSILWTSDSPADNKHLMISQLANNMTLATLVFSFVDGYVRYLATGESTDKSVMFFSLLMIAPTLISIFKPFLEDNPEQDVRASNTGFFSSCRRNRIELHEEKAEKKCSRY